MAHDARLQEATALSLPAPDHTGTPAVISAASLLATLVAFLCGDHLLLLRFLGVTSPIHYAVALGLIGVILRGLLQERSIGGEIPLRRLAICCAVAAVLLILGGEGRLFYANLDWQVRDAVLNDMTRWPWPFAYRDLGAPEFLRAPVGMYLVPALVGKLGGSVAADWALVVQNSAFLGTILALGSQLFDTRRKRAIALLVVVTFSGCDTLGAALARPHALFPLLASIDGWAYLQYSSHITMAFWVPHHALTGWFSGLLFMMWRSRRLSLAAFYTPLPLLALWSPLALMGVIPFAALAGVQTFVRRDISWRDFLLPATATGLAAVSLIYLQIDASRLGMRYFPVIPLVYGMVMVTEVVPFVLAVAWTARGGRFGWAALAIIAACLLAFPFVAIGKNVDFMMRAAIPVSAILSVLVADIVIGREHPTRTFIIVLLVIGALTPLREVARAIAYREAPLPLCTVPKAFTRSYAKMGLEQYLAPVGAAPEWLRPIHLFEVPANNPVQCWSRKWQALRY